MIITMNHTSVIPVPWILIRLMDSTEGDNRRLAVRFALQLLQDPDPLTRWGMRETFFQVPMRLYLEALSTGLQEQDQPEDCRKLGALLGRHGLGRPPAPYALIFRQYARLRLGLKLLYEQQISPVHEKNG